MQRSVLDGDDHRRLVRIAFGIYRDFAGYPRKVLGAGNRIAQFLGIGTSRPSDRVCQEVNGIVTKERTGKNQF